MGTGSLCFPILLLLRLKRGFDKPMRTLKLGSHLVKQGEANPEWFHVDATDKILGRLAVRIATVLMGKHKPTYTPHVDTGDFVVVTNAANIRVTGNKAQSKIYPRYSYYPGGYREIPYQAMMEKHPERIIEEAVRRMLPKNAIGRRMFLKLKVYSGEAHPHAAQRPQPLAM